MGKCRIRCGCRDLPAHQLRRRPAPTRRTWWTDKPSVSYAVSKLTALSALRRGALAGLIDPARIAVAGRSNGGDTVAAVAAERVLADHRIAAAIVLAGAEWPPLRGRYFPAASPPMLFVQGSADPINPPWASLQLYQADTTGPRYYLDVFGAGHLTPYEGDTAQERLVAQVTTEFLDRFVAGQHAARCDGPGGQRERAGGAGQRRPPTARLTCVAGVARHHPAPWVQCRLDPALPAHACTP